MGSVTHLELIKDTLEAQRFQGISTEAQSFSRGEVAARRQERIKS